MKATQISARLAVFVVLVEGALDGVDDVVDD